MEGRVDGQSEGVGRESDALPFFGDWTKDPNGKEEAEADNERRQILLLLPQHLQLFGLHRRRRFLNNRGKLLIERDKEKKRVCQEKEKEGRKEGSETRPEQQKRA